VGRNRRQLPERNVEALEDFARTGAAQRLDVARLDRLETELVRDAVHHAEKPREAVGERAVEVENDEGVAHARDHIRQETRSLKHS
jgi:hypothetical protein